MKYIEIYKNCNVFFYIFLITISRNITKYNSLKKIINIFFILETINENERVSAYSKLLSTLTPIPAATLRRILAHLHCLSQQSSKNLMTSENLSAIWGPTLMHAGENSAEEWNRSETRVIGDLIKLYPKLYQLTAADLAKEAKILEILEKHHGSNNGLRGAPSGDLKIWIYIFSRDGECVNVTVRIFFI